jgi:hypothetical protein
VLVTRVKVTVDGTVRIAARDTRQPANTHGRDRPRPGDPCHHPCVAAAAGKAVPSTCSISASVRVTVVVVDGSASRKAASSAYFRGAGDGGMPAV